MNNSSETIHVYLDCDWMDVPQLVGCLYREGLRGTAKYAFEFDREWLKKHANVKLSADLENFPGRQFQPASTEIFGCFSDAMPDRWGRLLLKRREQIESVLDQREPKTLNAMDLLCGIDDSSRMGALRFKRAVQGPFLNDLDKLPIPPIASLRELMHSVRELETSEAKNILPEQKWIQQLIKPGSSLGGARPKATVVDETGNLWIAKFPSLNDTYDIGSWEHFAYVMAKEAGISTSESKLVPIAPNRNIFLVKRFDRLNHKRVHFASSMTLLGLHDGDGASTGHGYLDIVDAILENCLDVEQNLEELYRRVAFNICIGNTDDHFQNHGFILKQKGWTLSPAYDLNPTTNRQQSLLINEKTDVSDLQLLKRSAKDYMLEQAKADSIIEDVISAMKRWEQVANSLRLPKRDIQIFKTRFLTEI